MLGILYKKCSGVKLIFIMCFTTCLKLCVLLRIDTHTMILNTDIKLGVLSVDVEKKYLTLINHMIFRVKTSAIMTVVHSISDSRITIELSNGVSYSYISSDAFREFEFISKLIG